MVKLVKLEIKHLPAMRIIGKTIRPNLMNENPIPAFWDQCFGDGTLTALEGLPESLLDSAYVGWMSDYNADDGTFTYLCGMLMKPGTAAPEGLVFRDVPACTVAIGWIQGPEKETYPVAHDYTQKALEEQGYKVDEEADWCMELYACPRFTQPNEAGEVILDYYIPCRKKDG
ncbi:MAG: GyrI-like domain-containing protein [Patescibacteria group bacterium]